jgi:hypothetical protein
LEPSTITSTTVRPFDGKNWEEHAAELASLSATPDDRPRATLPEPTGIVCPKITKPSG